MNDTRQNLQSRVAERRNPQAAVARTDEAVRTTAAFIQQMIPEIQRAAPKGLDADRVARLALTVVRKTPKLAECTPESFAGALLTAAALGLDIGINGEAYLVPYKDNRSGRLECTFVAGYQGLVKLFWQHPLARHIDAQVVFERDAFQYSRGTAPFLHHQPAVGDRGRVVAYYAVAGMSNGASEFVVLTPDEVAEIRGGKVGPNGDIRDPQRWTDRKTALRQLFKLIPKSVNLARAIGADERSGRDLLPELAAPPPQVEAPPPSSPPAGAESGDQGPADEPEGGGANPQTVAEPTDNHSQELANRQQMARLQAGFTDLGIKDRDKRLSIISGLVGRTLATGSELTVAEASKVIKALDDAKGEPDPVGWLTYVDESQVDLATAELKPEPTP